MSGDDDRKLFVAGLAEAVTEVSLRELFESTGGSVEQVSVPRDRATGRVRGFAFVTMGSEAEANKARTQLDGSIQDGRSISVRAFRGDRSAGPAPRHSSPPPAGDDSTLYVGNLPFTCTTAELEGVFRDAGFDDVRRIHLPTDQDGRARGFGFVSLETADSARRAVDEMAEVAMQGRRLSISVARARGKGGPPGPVGRGPGPRPSGAPPGPRPSRPPGAWGGSGPSDAPPPFRDDYPQDSFGPPAPPAPGDESRRSARWEKKKEKKRKGRLGGDESRGPKRKRGDGGGHSTRARDYVDDWDDDP